MKKLLTALLIIAVAAAFVNDLGRWVTASYTLGDHLREIADKASSAARVDPRQGWPTAAQAARGYGIEITGYSQKNMEVVIAARLPVAGTWVLGPANALLKKQPASTPIYVDGATHSYFH